jgi:hypothetical protein
MSKGWESHSVEEQQAQAEQKAEQAEAPAGRASEIDPAIRRAEDERKRRIQALELQRERILSERTSNPHRRSALELALADIERVLQELGWSIKL